MGKSQTYNDDLITLGSITKDPQILPNFESPKLSLVISLQCCQFHGCKARNLFFLCLVKKMKKANKKQRKDTTF